MKAGDIPRFELIQSYLPCVWLIVSVRSSTAIATVSFFLWVIWLKKTQVNVMSLHFSFEIVLLVVTC